MDLQVEASTLAALLLATARAAGFVRLAPPFDTRGIPIAAVPRSRWRWRWC